jgi:hypothetical protein
MKFLLFLLVVILFAGHSGYGQTRKAAGTKSKRSAKTKKTFKTPYPIVEAEAPPPPPAPSAEKYASSDVFKDEAIGQWDILGFSIPQDLTGGIVRSNTSTNKDVMWTTTSRDWRHSAPIYPDLLNVELSVTTWNADFKKVMPDLRPDLATPETLLFVDVMGDFNKKSEPGSFVKEAYFLEIGGVKGGFFRGEFPTQKDRFLAGWYTYRYFEGKAQRISLNVTGRKSELPKLMKIIQSLKFQ